MGVVDMEVDKLADTVVDMEVDMVADEVMDMVEDMEVDKVADKIADMVMDMEVDKVADMVVDKDMVAYNQYSFWSFQIFHWTAKGLHSCSPEPEKCEEMRMTSPIVPSTRLLIWLSVVFIYFGNHIWQMCHNYVIESDAAERAPFFNFAFGVHLLPIFLGPGIRT